MVDLIVGAFNPAARPLLWQINKVVGFYSVDGLLQQTRIGPHVKPLGPPRIIAGEPHFAGEFPFDAVTLRRVRASFGIKRPVIEHITYLTPEDRSAA